MGLSNFQMKVRNAIIQQLEMGPASTAELAVSTKYNYHSVRGQVRALEDEGVIKPLDRSYRNTKFVMGSDNGPNNIIPILHIDDKRFKLQELLQLRHNDNPHGAQAVHNIPKHLARLFKAAIRVSEGRDTTLTLTALKTDMVNDLQALKRAVYVYEQVLQDDRNWNPENLKRYPLDATFEQSVIDSAYVHYFKVEGND